LTVWKGKFWQFEKGNFDSLKRIILTVWKGKFWQFEKGNFDSLKGNFDSLKRIILTVWKGKFWQFEKGNFDSLKRIILTVWNKRAPNPPPLPNPQQIKYNFGSPNKEVRPFVENYWIGKKRQKSIK
jgi:hypothetical protein